MWPPIRSGITLYVWLDEYQNIKLTATEPLGLQINVMLDALLVCLALDSRLRLLRRLRCRCFHRRQPPRFQQMVQPGTAEGAFRSRQVDLRYHHHHLIRLLSLPRH